MSLGDKSSFLKTVGIDWGNNSEETLVNNETPVQEIEEQQQLETEVEHDTSAESVQETSETNVEEQVEEGEGDIFETFYLDEEQQQESNQLQPEAQQETKVKDKVKYNLKDYIEANDEAVSRYFKFKNLNPDTMSNEELLRFKLQQENPSWDAQDIQDTLKDTYGIGERELEVPEDALDDERREIERENREIRERIRRGERLMKSDVFNAKQLLKKEQENLVLPEVELDVELTADPSHIIEQYNQQIQEQSTKFREEVWNPAIKETVGKLGGFKQKFDFEVEQGSKVASELTFKLTPEQKVKLENYLTNYTAHPEDDKYVLNQETGEIDYQRFVNDKAEGLFAKEIIKSYSKELFAQFKQKFVKENIVNYSDEPRRVSKSDDAPKDFAIQQFEKRAATMEQLRGKR